MGEADLERAPLLVAKPAVTPAPSRLIMGCLFASQFTASMDSTMVVTLLNRISSDFDSQQSISWIATGYLLSCAACQPLFGKLSDVLGRKVMLNLCQVFFVIGCLTCSTSNSLSGLILGRVITGIGGGGMQTITSICISDLVTLKERGLYQGYISVSWQMGVISGGLIAGIFDSLWGWKFAFGVQAPFVLVIASIVALYMDLPIDKKHSNTSSIEKLKTIDWFGSILLVTSLLSLLLLFGTSDEEIKHFGLLWFALVFYSILGFISFYKWESKISNPVVPVKLLKHPTIVKTALNSFFAQMNFYGALYYLPFYWTSVQHQSPLQAGYRLIPTTFTACSTSVIVGYLIKRLGKYHQIHLLAGLLIIGGSMIIFTQSKSYGPIVESILPIPMRIGSSMNFNVMIVSMLSSVTPEEQSLVSSIHYGVKSTGSTLGVSISNYVMQTSLEIFMEKFVMGLEVDGWSLNDLSKVMFESLNDPNYPIKANLPVQIVEAVEKAYGYACHAVYAFMIVCAVGIFAMIYQTTENDLTDGECEDIEEYIEEAMEEDS